MMSRDICKYKLTFSAITHNRFITGKHIYTYFAETIILEKHDV